MNLTKRPVINLVLGVLTLSYAFGTSSILAKNTGFVTTNGTQFVLNGRPYYYAGTNFWYGMNLASAGPGGDRSRLSRELNVLKTLGLTNLRIMAASEGPNTEPWRMVPALQISPGVYDPNILDGLDYLLKEMGEWGLRAVMCLNNFWSWSGGMAQYLNWNASGPIPYPPPEPGGDWNTYTFYTDDFYSNVGAQQDFQNFINFILNHVNPYAGLAYKDDPTIIAWELANEARGYQNSSSFNTWINETAAYIKSLDSNHLVTTGCEGDTPWPSWNGLDFIANHSSPDIDYTTCHIWPQNWGWYDPSNPSSYANAESQARDYLLDHLDKAENIMGKPLVLEEFGMARDDGSYDPQDTTSYREMFYQAMFVEIFISASSGGPGAGSNFWAWAGEGHPLQPHGSHWSSGDPWLGDPPHEQQGWYSVYDTDESLLGLISEHAEEMQGLTHEQTFLTVVLNDIDSELTSPQGDYRWLDVNDQVYAESYRNNYDYTKASVLIQHSTDSNMLHGLLIATNLKPNFAYQLKIVGTPETPSNELIGFTGRWWQEEWNGLEEGNGGAWINGWNLNDKGDGSSPNPNDDVYLAQKDILDPTSPTRKKYRYTAYLVFDYFNTDEYGNAIVDFIADSCYHVLWKTTQREHTASDGPIKAASFDPDTSSPAYDVDHGRSTVSVFGEWERLPVGSVFLPEAEYHATFILTEESFHGSGDDLYDGGWAAAIGGPADFNVIDQRTLTTSSTFGGTVSTPGEGSFDYDHGTFLPIIADADPNYHFVAWTGTAVDAGKVADPNTASTTVTMDADYDLQANFVTRLNIINVDDDAPGDPGPNDPALSDPSEDGTPAHPFDMIQEAINVAVNSVAIIVHEGVFNENIDFTGKNIVISSTDPNEPNVVSNTVIHGSRLHSVVSFVSGETTDCLLTGLTITGGNAEFGGGIYCYNSSPTISKCVVSGNWAERGGGMYNYDNSPTLVNCVLSGNWAILYGGGIYNVDSSCTAVLNNCTLSGNSADSGGGIYNQSSDLLLTDSILWGNDDNGGTDESAQIDVNDSVALVNYSCVQGWTGALGGIGNFDADPCFAELGYWDDNATPMDVNDDVWVNGDYHLRSEDGRWDPNENDWVYDAATSPCIDAGDPNSDWTAEPWPNGKRANMGGYGGTYQASLNGNTCDFNVDGTVNFADFCDMADYWQVEGSLTNDSDYDNLIDFADLRLFTENWLWQKAKY